MSWLRVALFAFLLSTHAPPATAEGDSSARGSLTASVFGNAKPVTAEELSHLPRRSANVTTDGKQTVYEGVALADFLELAEVQTGDDLHGKALLQYVIVEAQDGYGVVFSLAEVDRDVILADRRDGQPLSAEEGPVRVIAPEEKQGVRFVTAYLYPSSPLPGPRKDR